MKFADLHVHSNFSDGTQRPHEIVEAAKSAGLSCLALTDHDTTEAFDALSEITSIDLEILPGIEMSCDFFGQEVHILGYLMDYKDPAFQKRLTYLKDNRIQRIVLMCQRLKKLGVNIAPEEVFSLSGQGTVGRLHIARLMLKKRYVANIPAAFARYIGNHSPCYVAKYKMSPREAVGWITKLGGVAVLAHPYSLTGEALIRDFVKLGVKGLEVFYPEHTAYQTEEFKKIAAMYNLIMTGGSDYHGEAKKKTFLGCLKLPYQYVEDLKKAR